MNKMDLVLVNPGNRKQTYGRLAEQFSGIEPPIWCGLTAAFIRQYGYSVKIIDSELENLSPQELALEIVKYNPLLVDIVVLGANPSASSTPKMTTVSEILNVLKKKSPYIKTILSGLHVSALPERTLREENTDFVCQGEGFYTKLKLLEKLKSGKTDFHKIEGLWYKEDGKIISNPPAPLIENLDELGFAAWDLLPMDRYRAHNWHCLGNLKQRSPYAAIYTSFGCPFNCSFCNIHALYNGKPLVRYRSSEKVVEEIGLLVKNYKIKNLKIADELFVLDEERVDEICELIIKEKYDLNIFAYARIDTVNESILRKMKRAGINWLCFGIESASEQVRRGVSKIIAQEKIKKAVEMTKNAGIHVLGNFIFGLPEDTLETMQENLNMAKDLKFDYVNFYTCFVPGTPVYHNPTVTPIDKIVKNQEIFSLKTNTKVVSTTSRPYNGIVYKVKPRFLPPVVVTPEHPFLVAELRRIHRSHNYWKAEIQAIKWKLVKDILVFDTHDARRTYDAVMIPKKLLREEQTYIDFSPFVKGHIGGGQRGGQLSQIGKRFLDPWPVTSEFAEFMGWYIAEGCLESRANNTISFCLGSEEIDNIKRVQKLIAQCFGYKSRLLHLKNEKGVKIVFVSKVLSRALPVLTGDRAHNKRIPECIMNAPKEICRAFLKGYIEGDGTSQPKRNNQMSVSSCSKELIHQLIMLFLKIGIVPGYAEYPPGQKRIKGVVKKRGIQYRLYFSDKTKFRHYLEDENFFYIPVKTIEKEYYQGNVYNLSTQDQTYAVPFIVHNCMAYPGSRLYEEALKKGIELPKSWLGYAQLSEETLALPTKYISGRDVLRFRDKAFYEYYTNSEYLKMIEDKFGLEAVEHIKQMLEIKVYRKLLGDKL
jgi:radical SAM superfamily enzyme YgiQ (UPF0313 family)